MIKKVLSTWKAFRSIFDLDHKSSQLCLWVHMPDGGRALRMFLMDLLTFVKSKSGHGDGGEAWGVIHTSHPRRARPLPGYLVQGIQGRNVWETSWAGAV